MLYSAFVREVNKGAKEAIAAYDSTAEPPGCLIYVGGMDQTIFVPSELFSVYKDELVTFLRSRILDGLPVKAHLIVGLYDGALKLRSDTVASKANRAVPRNPIVTR